MSDVYFINQRRLAAMSTIHPGGSCKENCRVPVEDAEPDDEPWTIQDTLLLSALILVLVGLMTLMSVVPA